MTCLGDMCKCEKRYERAREYLNQAERLIFELRPIGIQGAFLLNAFYIYWLKRAEIADCQGRRTEKLQCQKNAKYVVTYGSFEIEQS